MDPSSVSRPLTTLLQWETFYVYTVLWYDHDATATSLSRWSGFKNSCLTDKPVFAIARNAQANLHTDGYLTYTQQTPTTQAPGHGCGG